MATKDCGQHKNKKKELIKKILIGVAVFVGAVLLTIFIIWLVLRPQKPSFILQDATVVTFNLSSPNLLTSTFQLTVQSRNPNSRISVYYDRLIIYASYRNQQITLPTSIPPTYQDRDGVNLWSPYVTGVEVPIATVTGQYLNQDRAAGRLEVDMKMDGRVRWRVGSFVSGKYELRVNCPAVMTTVGNSSGGGGTAPATSVAKYQLLETCSVGVNA